MAKIGKTGLIAGTGVFALALGVIFLVMEKTDSQLFAFRAVKDVPAVVVENGDDVLVLDEKANKVTMAFSRGEIMSSWSGGINGMEFQHKTVKVDAPSGEMELAFKKAYVESMLRGFDDKVVFNWQLGDDVNLSEVYADVSASVMMIKGHVLGRLILDSVFEHDCNFKPYDFYVQDGIVVVGKDGLAKYGVCFSQGVNKFLSRADTLALKKDVLKKKLIDVFTLVEPLQELDKVWVSQWVLQYNTAISDNEVSWGEFVDLVDKVEKRLKFLADGGIEQGTALGS